MFTLLLLNRRKIPLKMVKTFFSSDVCESWFFQNLGQSMWWTLAFYFPVNEYSVVWEKGWGKGCNTTTLWWLSLLTITKHLLGKYCSGSQITIILKLFPGLEDETSLVKTVLIRRSLTAFSLPQWFVWGLVFFLGGEFVVVFFFYLTK